MVLPPHDAVRNLSLSPTLGTLFTMSLYGATCMQVYQYYNNYPEDSVRLKALVAFVFTLETVQAALSCHYTVTYLVVNFGNIEILARCLTSVWLSSMVGIVIAWTVNQFFVRRIYILSKKNLWVTIAISVLATIRPAFALTACSMAIKYPVWAVFKVKAQWIMVTGLSLGLAVDCLITFSITYYLLRGRTLSLARTRGIINALIKYTLNTGAILVLFGTIELLGLVLSKRSLVFLGLYQVQVQLYANCFLTSLSARKSQWSGDAPMVSLNSSPHFGSTFAKHPGNIAVRTETTMTVDELQTSNYEIEKSRLDV